MDNLLLQVVLQNNHELFVYASKLQNGLIEDMTDKVISVSVDSKHVPQGWKLGKGGYRYTCNTKVLKHNLLDMNKPFLTEFGWCAESNSELSTLEVDEKFITE